MMNKVTTDIINAIKSAERILVCGHIRPDGDCVGAALAVRHICQTLGKTADAVCDADKPSDYAFLPEYNDFCAPRYKTYDLFIAVDCATEKRLGEYQAMLNAAKVKINIDHHPTNPLYGNINHVLPEKCSTCAILYDLFAEGGYLDEVSAIMLYTGISTDTGHFMHSNTDGEVFRTASELCGYGIDVGQINHDLYCNKSFNKIKLTARVLQSIILYENGSIALMPIMLDDLNECGCKSEDTEGLINYASSISGVKIAISMCEQPGNLYRVSFRSVEADVSIAAARFGGGGHRLAAGCIINGNRYDVMDKVLSAAISVLNK